MAMNGRIETLADPPALARHVADWMTSAALAAKGDFRVSLSGGSTPKALFTLLASDLFVGRFPWNRVSWFWGDERFVPYDHPDSNYRMTREAMLAKATERRVGRAAGDELALAGDHARDEQLDLAVFRACRREQLERRGANGPGVAQAQPHEAALGLVRDRTSAQLDGDRHAQIRRCGNGGIGVGAQSLVRDWNAGRREPALRFVLRERRGRR